MKQIIKGGGVITTQIEKDKALEIEQEAKMERAKARNKQSKVEQEEVKEQINKELHVDRKKKIGEEFVNKGDKIQEKKIKN